MNPGPPAIRTLPPWGCVPQAGILARLDDGPMPSRVALIGIGSYKPNLSLKHSDIIEYIELVKVYISRLRYTFSSGFIVGSLGIPALSPKVGQYRHGITLPRDSGGSTW